MMRALSPALRSGLAQERCRLVSASHGVEILLSQIESGYFPGSEDRVVSVASLRSGIEEWNIHPVLFARFQRLITFCIPENSALHKNVFSSYGSAGRVDPRLQCQPEIVPLGQFVG
jgi:hypothetical protein